MTTIQFLGATGTVTGSKYLLRTGSQQILLDCGLFQGYKQLRLRNWDRFPVDPRSIHAVVLTHAHIDHTGYLPRLVQQGFAGTVFCTAATRELAAILLPDSGHLQEEEAEYANRRSYSKHRPALPLYTRAEAEQCLRLFRAVDFEQDISLGDSARLRFSPSGHILGSSFARFETPDTSILFSGDIGRPEDPIMVAPTKLAGADYLVLESTYGDRRHDPTDPLDALADTINRTYQRQGAVIVPAFAVGRAQALLYYIHLLKEASRIPDLPVFLNSPMAADVTGIYHNHRGEHRLTPEQCDAMCRVAHIVNTAEESKQLNERRGPMIIVSASGMATGGRVLHHLKAFAPDARNTVLFAGFQAGGTRGAALVGGATTIKIHGEYVPIRAEVRALSNLSAHADYAEIIDWLNGFQAPPKQTFITHGEPAAADALRHRIEEQKRWRCTVPDYLETAELT